MGELDSPGVSLIHILKLGPSSLCTHNLTSSLTDLDFLWVGKKERRERRERERERERERGERIWGWDSVERETLEKNIWWVEEWRRFGKCKED